MIVKQMKSNWYYWFWGAATVAVVAGQIYIGSGYHSMTNQVQNLIEVIKND